MEQRYLKQLDAIASDVRRGVIPERVYVIDDRRVDLTAFLHEAREDARDRVNWIKQHIAALRVPAAATAGDKPRDPHKAFVDPGKAARIDDHPAAAARFLAVLATSVRRSEALPETLDVGGHVLKLADALVTLAKDTRSPASEAASIAWLDKDASVGAVASALLNRLCDEGVLQRPKPAAARVGTAAQMHGFR